MYEEVFYDEITLKRWFELSAEYWSSHHLFLQITFLSFQYKNRSKYCR
jgi:hypothetical protein